MMKSKSGFVSHRYWSLLIRRYLYVSSVFYKLVFLCRFLTIKFPDPKDACGCLKAFVFRPVTGVAVQILLSFAPLRDGEGEGKV